MRKYLLLYIILVVCSLPILPAPKIETPALDPGELEPLVEIERKWDSAMSAVPTDRGQALLKVLTDDVIIMIGGEPPLRGKEAVRRHYENPNNYYAALSVVSNVEQAEVSGQLAVVRGTYTYRTTWKPGYNHRLYTSGHVWGSGVTTLGEGSFIDVLRREDDGSWKFALSAWNATSQEHECPDPYWTFRGYALGMSEEDALQVLPAKQDKDTKVESWGGETWTAELPGEYETRIYLSPSDQVIAFSMFHEVAAKTLLHEAIEHWGGFNAHKRKRVRVSGHTVIRMDHFKRHQKRRPVRGARPRTRHSTKQAANQRIAHLLRSGGKLREV
jgi:ketosteroid isomerase-like protein